MCRTALHRKRSPPNKLYAFSSPPHHPACASPPRPTGAALADQLADHEPNPWFCRDKECPTFKVKKTTDQYEQREYDAAAWVAFNTTGLKFELAMGRASASLARYFKGQNEQEVKMNLTTPLATLMRLEERGGYDINNNFTIALVLPAAQQHDPPKPSLEGPFVFCTGSRTVFVRGFSGFATEESFKEQHSKLRDALLANNEEFDDGGFVAAVYDGPTVLTNRHNEIWLIGGGEARGVMAS